jgi:hypothetical protein
LKSKLPQNPTLYQSGFLTEKTEIENDVLLGNNVSPGAGLTRFLEGSQLEHSAEQ